MTTVPGYAKIENHAGMVELVDSVDLGDVTLGKVFRGRDDEGKSREKIPAKQFL